MRKPILILMVTFFVTQANAQIEVAKLTGKNSSDYQLGFGGFLKFSYPVSDAGDVSIEGSLVFFFAKENSGDGLALTPIKVGYRYTFDGSGAGFYLEPTGRL